MQRSTNRTAFQSAWLARPQAACRSWVPGANRSQLQGSSLLLRVPERHVHRVETLQISANGNGAESKNESHGDDIVDDTPQQTEPAMAKEKLIRTITELINDDNQINEVKKLILRLESLNVTPITDVFTDMGLSGRWKLIFSSTRTRAAGKIRIRKIGQTFKTEEKELINEANWSFTGKDGVHQITAVLYVICSYKFVGPGRIEVTVGEHKIKILGGEDGTKYETPDDLQALVGELQLALPIDFFDPSGLIDVSYMEPNFRLARFEGKRIAGVRNVFIRDHSK